MEATLTHEEHVAKLKELLKENESESYHLKCQSKGGQHHGLSLLRIEKEFLKHELEKLTWSDQPTQAPAIVSSNNDGEDGPDDSKRQPVLA